MAKKPKIDCGNFTSADIGLLVGETTQQMIQMQQLNAKMNAELNAVRARYEEKLQNLAGNIMIRVATMEAWATEHKDLFVETRSMEFERGTIRFRTGQHKLKLLAKRTWDHVCANLINAGPHGYTRTETTVAKDLLIADREKLGEKVLAQIGVKVVQEDAFQFDPKTDEPADAVVNIHKAG